MKVATCYFLTNIFFLLLLLQVRGGRDDRPAAYSRLSQRLQQQPDAFVRIARETENKTKRKKKDEKEADLFSDSRDGRAGPDNK